MSDELTKARQGVCEALAELTGFEHAVFVQSGTAALEVALSVLTSPRDGVTIPGLGCWTVPFAVAKVGRTPIFVDLDEQWGSCPNPNQSAFASITIDPWGAPGSWPTGDRGNAHQVAIADVTQAPGARLWGDRAAQRFDAAILSFGWGKPIALGGGGCALFRDGKAFAEAQRYLRFGFFDGQWSQKIDRYTFSPFLFLALHARLDNLKRTLDGEIAAAEEARNIFADGAFLPNQLRPGGRWGLWSVLPLRVAKSVRLSPRDLETVAVSSGVPLVRHPVSPAYLEPAWEGTDNPQPHCPRAEALASSLVFFERIQKPGEFAALKDFVNRVQDQADKFRTPFLFPRPRGHLSAELCELAGRARLSRAIDGQFYLLDELAARKVPLGPVDAALVQQLQQKAVA